MLNSDPPTHNIFRAFISDFLHANFVNVGTGQILRFWSVKSTNSFEIGAMLLIILLNTDLDINEER